MRQYFLLSLLTLWSVPAFSQLVSVGVKAGVPLTNVYSTQQVPDGNAFTSETRFTVGPTVELHLPLHFSVELDALWRRSSFSTIGGNFSNVAQDSAVNDWQVPLLAKFDAGVGPVHPFVDAGPVYRHVSTSSSSVPSPSHADSIGIAIGGGISLRLLHVRMEPEIRYTRWLTSAFDSNYGGPVESKNNQADLLVGFTF
jgi:hypothetical protein